MSYSINRTVAVLALLALLPIGAAGSWITISNASFETPATPPGTFIADSNAPPSGWTVFGSTSSSRVVGVVNPNSTSLYTDPVPAGSNVGVVFLLNAGSSPAGIQQTLGHTLQLSTRYTLIVEVGNMATDPNPPHNSFNFTGFPGYRIELLAGGTVIAMDNNTLLPGEGRFLTSTVTVTIGANHVNAGQPLGIRLVNLNGPGIEVNFDLVRLDAVALDPPLSITRSGSATARIEWPTNFPDYTLEFTTNLSASVWEPVTNSVGVTSNVFEVEVETAAPLGVFRLNHP